MDKDKLLDELRIDRQAPEPRSPISWIIAGIIVALLVVGGVVWWVLARPKEFTVQIATAAAPAVQGSNATPILQATGYVTARREATVSAQITGTLIEVLIEEGEKVAAGQVLARLEDTSQRARLAEAQAQLEQSRAQVSQFDSQLAQSRRDLQRQQDLIKQKVVSQQAFETAGTQVDTLQSQLATQRRSVALAEAQVKSAHVQLDYTIVRAPFAGVVIAKAAQVGEIVSPLSAGGGFTRTGIGTIVDMNSLEIEVDVNEAYINRVAPNAPAQAVLDAYQDWTIPAHVIAIIPTADRGKATVKVRVGLDQKDPRILPDMGARVSFLEPAAAANAGGSGANGDAGDAAGGGAGGAGAAPQRAPSGALLPASAIVERDGKSLVFAVEGKRARARAVTPGPSFSDLRLVEGISIGTRVVRTPPDEMVDGARILEEKP